MKEIFNDYKEIFTRFLKNKKYMYILLFVGILSYGFTITHYSIGIDDLSLDRYVQGTYILSAKRWGTWALYNVLHIVRFSPFWLDFIVATLMILMALLICTAIKRVVKEKFNIWAYIIFGAIFVSNPLIAQFFIFQSTNLSVAVSNILAIISAIIVFENYFNLKNKWYFILAGGILIFAISSYESCFQTYLVIYFMMLFLKVLTQDIKIKKLIEAVLYGFFSGLIGIIGYYITGSITIFILDKMHILQNDLADHSIPWLANDFINLSFDKKIEYINKNVIIKLANGIKSFLPVPVFIISSIISIAIGVIQKNKNKSIIVMLLLFIVAFNYILLIAQIEVSYRIQFSWIVTTAFLCMYIYIMLKDKRIIKYLISISLVLLIVLQTNNLNNLFYNDYRRYEKEKFVANQIVMDIKKCDNYNDKKILYIITSKNTYTFVNDFDHKIYYLLWGTLAFKEYGTETTKFLNNLGYNFKTVTEVEYEKVIKDNYNIISQNEDKNVLELDNYIIVNLTHYLSE